MEDAVQAGVTRATIFAALVAIAFGLGLVAVLAELLAWRGRRARGAIERRVGRVFIGVASFGLCCVVYGACIEADWLTTTQIEVRTPKLQRGERVRIVLLSDLHVRHPSRALAELPAAVTALEPDLLIFTGDSIATRRALPLFREVLGGLPAKHGRFAVKGNHDVWYFPKSDLFGGGVAHELTGSATVAAGLVLCGVPYGSEGLLARCLSDHPEGFRVVVHHTPDSVEDLQGLQPDLYLAGHTHGGQIRLPFYGALMTMSQFDKRYEMGRYQVGPTTLFVTRGVGFEPLPAPRVRFLCPPEIAVIDVIGEGS